MDDKVYRQLQRHLDKQAVGFPAARSGADIRFLKRLFTPEEAKLALHLSYRPMPTDEVTRSAAPEFKPDAVERLLDSMQLKGAIGLKTTGGLKRWYVMPVVIGMYEAQDGSPTPDFLADAGAYMRTTGFQRTFLAVEPSQMRTIPVNESISVEHNVATYDEIHGVLDACNGPFVILQCICREAKSIRGEDDIPRGNLPRHGRHGRPSPSPRPRARGQPGGGPFDPGAEPGRGTGPPAGQRAEAGIRVLMLRMLLWHAGLPQDAAAPGRFLDV